MPFFDKDVSNKGDLTTFMGVVQDFGNYTVDILIESLQDKVRGYTSKFLEQSIRFDVQPTGKNAYRFIVYFEEYGNYIDEGVQGIGGRKSTGGTWRNVAPRSQFRFNSSRKPSERHFRTWANAHGLNSFAVRESVWRKGIKPNEWFTEIIDEGNLIPELIERFEKNGAKQLEIDIAKTITASWLSQ